MLREVWQRITRTRRTLAVEAAASMECALKEEVARLRAENRALLNSILGIAGVPPITVGAGPAPIAARGGASPANDMRHSIDNSSATESAGLDSGAANACCDKTSATEGPADRPGMSDLKVRPPKNAAQMALPTRRRSWHQINRMLEFEAAKKKEQVVGGKE